MKRVLSGFVIFIFTLSSTYAGILDELRARQGKITSVKAGFMQKKETRLLSRPIQSSGNFYYKRPDMIRWEYTGSSRMDVLYNGRELWLYYPELNEAEKYTGVSRYTSILSFDISRMSKEYTVRSSPGNDSFIVTLVPAKTGAFSQIEMEFMNESAFPRKTRLIDTSGNTTVIFFEDVTVNPRIPDALFHFTPAEGTKVRERSFE